MQHQRGLWLLCACDYRCCPSISSSRHCLPVCAEKKRVSMKDHAPLGGESSQNASQRHRSVSGVRAQLLRRRRKRARVEAQSATPGTVDVQCDPGERLDLVMADVEGAAAEAQEAALEEERRSRVSASADAAARRHRLSRQDQHREQGLVAALPKDNKGFRMLRALGWTQDTGLGRRRDGRTEPVAIQSKRSRAGVGAAPTRTERGAAAFRAEVRQSAVQARDQSPASLGGRGEDHTTAFREQASAQFRHRAAERDLRQAQLACRTLDEQRGVPAHRLWPAGPNATEGAVAEGPSTAEEIPGGGVEGERDCRNELRETLQYLRSTHGYCLFCAVRTSPEELEQVCPGPDRAAHDEPEQQ